MEAMITGKLVLFMAKLGEFLESIAHASVAGFMSFPAIAVFSCSGPSGTVSAFGIGAGGTPPPL